MRARTTTVGGAGQAAKPFAIELTQDETGLTMLLHGRFDHQGLAGALAEAYAALEGTRGPRLAIDLSSVVFLDSAGALTVIEIANEAQRRGIQTRVANATPEQRALIDLIDPGALAQSPLIGERGERASMARIGEAAAHLVRELVDTISFAGHLIATTAWALAHPRSIRWKEVRAGIQRIGVDGLPIIGLLSFLMGFIIGAMAVSNLRQLSMNSLISAVVAVAMLQEFGPLITSLVTAGRVGSAFAAEIATMVVREEVDALAAMGHEPVAFLGVPKLFATVVAVPLITFYADALGILGGLLVARTQLQIQAYPYFTLIPGNVSLFSFVVATVKTFLFAFIIATVGCRQGFAARGGAEGVGRATTSAVVAGILLIIFTDFLFALLVNYLG